MRTFEDIKIAVAGTGYVGLSLATLLSQKHTVTACVQSLLSSRRQPASVQNTKFFPRTPARAVHSPPAPAVCRAYAGR